MKVKEDILGPILEVPEDFDQDNILEMSVPDDDKEVQMSPADEALAKSDRLLNDLDIPTHRELKSMTNVDKERWLVVIETLLQRGVKSKNKMTRLLNLPTYTVNKFVQEVMGNWQQSLSVGTINCRREQIYLEAERVKEYAWRALTMVDNDSAKLKYLQLILHAGQRQSSLIGAEKQQVEAAVTVQAQHKSTADFENEFIDIKGISGEQLKDLGDVISRQLSLNKTEED